MRATPSTSPFAGAAGGEQAQGRRAHENASGGHRHPVGARLGADVHHVRAPAAIEMRQRALASGLACHACTGT